MRTTVDLPVPLLERAKKLAAESDITLSVVVSDALRGYLSQATARTNKPFVLHTVGGKLIRPDLDLDRTSSLLLEDDQAEFGASR